MSSWTPGWSTQPPQPHHPVIALRDGSIVRFEDGWLSPWQGVREWVSDPASAVNLGTWEGQPLYAVEMDVTGNVGVPETPLREALLGMPDAPADLLGTAFQVCQWWRDHRFCGRCGGVTDLHPQERAKWCEPCGIPWYPRVAPCVIVMIRREDRLLLARSSRVKRHFYSLIAGFVEPGESLEQAVVREVREETGLDVTNIRYRASQPWPFPHQLMMGFFADYRGGELVLQQDELADAGWFLPGEMPPVPPETTIAGRLIREMVETLQHGGNAPGSGQ